MQLTVNKSKVFIIVPCYNEGTVIRNTLKKLLTTGYQIILIDDGSTDETPKLTQDFPIHYIRHIVNLGQGAALQSGMQHALQLGAEIVVHFDADGQHQINDISQVIAPILQNEADIVLGSRFQNSSNNVPFSKKILLRLGIILNGFLTGIWLSDAHNGLRAMNERALSTIRLQVNGMAHASEILIEIKKHKLRFKEVPVEIQYTEYSMQKGQSIWNSFHIFTDLLARKFLP